MARNIAPAIRNDNRPISVIIPAAGLGSRMKSYGPKSLVKIKDNLSIIENQLKFIYKYLNKPQIILVTGYESKLVESCVQKYKNITVVRNEEWEDTNVVASIAKGLEFVKHENVLIIYGDLVFNAWTLKVPFGNDSMVLVDKKGFMKEEEVGCTVQSNMLENMMYGLNYKWAQISYFTKHELILLKRFLKNPLYNTFFGFEIINMIISSGGKFIAHSNPRMKIIDIDSSRDLIQVEEII